MLIMKKIRLLHLLALLLPLSIASCNLPMPHIDGGEIVSITLDAPTLELKEGETHQFIATINPKNATYKSLIWSVTNESVGSVTQNGYFTAKEEGKAIIGWRVTGAMNKEYQGSELTLNMTNGTLNINPIIGNATGIDNVEQNLNSQQSTVYDLMGNKVTTPQAGRIYIQNGKKIIW